MTGLKREWVEVWGSPRIHVELFSGMVAVFGNVWCGKPEYLEIGWLSDELLAWMRLHHGKEGETYGRRNDAEGIPEFGGGSSGSASRTH